VLLNQTIVRKERRTNRYFFVVVVQVNQIFPTLVPNLCLWINFYITYTDC